MSPFATFLCALLLGLCQGQPATCPYKECSCSNTIIDCSNRGLRSVPSRLNTGATFTTLLLNGNNITLLNGSDILPTKLDTLDLSDNPLVNISNEAFYGISQTLKVIKFRNSRFPTLPVALELLDNLDTLDIENNPMTITDGSTVSKLAKSLLTLRLANVNLVGWPAWLSRFVFLRRLFVDGNTRIGSIPIGSFDIWRYELTHLSLSNTGLSTVSAVSVLQTLQWLDLSRNRIQDSTILSYDLIPLGSSLRFLDLSFNTLTTEPRLVDLRALTDVYLTSNAISYLSPGAFSPSVININLDNNRFTSIPAFINDLPQLLNFSIRANQITSLGAHDFPVNSRLTFFYAGGNPITNIDEHAFDNFRNYLTYLDLENTRITRLPLALKALLKLQTLWIPNNGQLVCTCNEKSLVQWLATLPTLRVVGQCGNVDIKEFVGQLASLCP